ncbi:hypothetical protein CMI44_02045 [Candidatus Pacearchaeota archaeon]|nr:hypothetical protein [Candidatus Pacearchaeota archaeon]
MGNKKAVSGIITILIIIAIVLAISGIFWYVINSVVGSARTEIEQGSADLYGTCSDGKRTIEGGTNCSGSEEVRIVGGEYCCMPV